MAAIEQCTVLLLAAGLSRRFGAADKLMSDWRGRPLADHAAATLEQLPFLRRIALVRRGAPALSAMLAARGFAIIENERPDQGMAHSIGLGIGAASGSQTVLIALADMPEVPETHFAALIAAAGDDADIVASRAIEQISVPAAFMARRFDDLKVLSGDQGARAMLSSASTVEIDPLLLTDVDRPLET